MSPAAEILVIILAIFLAVFLILGIMLIVYLIYLTRQIRTITKIAQTAIGRIESAAGGVSRLAVPMTVIRKITQVVKKLNRIKRT